MLEVTHLSRYKNPKVLPPQKAAALISRLKKAGKTVGVCQGGYDLLHPGHVTHFESAKKACDVLFVSVTRDKFVAGRKGLGRPIFTDTLRAFMIASLSVVDYVVVTDFKSGVDVINLLKPTLYIKGPDFIGKETPGITAERAAIAASGGKMHYTRDPKLSTTDIISYIRNNIIDDAMLVVIDRDGTLIADTGFFGRDSGWRKKLSLNRDVAAFLYYLKTNRTATYIVVSNQAGVARKFFTEKTVRDINAAVGEELKKFGVTVSGWEYCPDVDAAYDRQHPEFRMDRRYVKDKTKRKPAPDMALDALKKLGLTAANFKTILVLGDRDEDRGLAQNLGGLFLDVTGKSYQSLLTEFGSLEKGA